MPGRFSVERERVPVQAHPGTLIATDASTVACGLAWAIGEVQREDVVE